jgi:DNA repair protein RadC
MKYVTTEPLTAEQVLDKAIELIDARYTVGAKFTCSQTTKDYLKCKLGIYEKEVFAVLFMDSQHGLIEYKEMFFGTINAAAVYPREIVKLALTLNAAAVVLAHNHPSGLSEASLADKQITERIKKALALIDINVLDHIIIAKEPLSFAETGLL